MPAGFKHALKSETEKLTACVHCGLCLSSCPTYVELGNENDSPRGRLYLMRAVAENRLVVGDTFKRHIDQCLGCRACETICPSGVPYGYLLERARARIVVASKNRKTMLDRLTEFVLNRIFTSPRRLQWLLAPARWFRDSSLLKLLVESRELLDELPGAMKAIALLRSTVPIRIQAVSPTDHGPPSAPRLDATREFSADAVELFAGCVMRELFRHTNEATIRVLQANGWQVRYPEDQVCCGALHAHAGYLETARRLARSNIDLFEAGQPADSIIVNAAGCGAMLKEYGELLQDDPEYHERAAAFSSRVQDICEFLERAGFEPGPRAVPATLCYDAPCHLHHAQGVRTAPIALIRRLSGVVLVPLPDAESCCGGAGIYNLLHPGLAGRILDRKIEQIRDTGAEIVLTGNPGCIMQIASGIATRGLSTRVAHPIELIAASYG